MTVTVTAHGVESGTPDRVEVEAGGVVLGWVYPVTYWRISGGRYENWRAEVVQGETLAEGPRRADAVQAVIDWQEAAR